MIGHGLTIVIFSILAGLPNRAAAEVTSPFGLSLLAASDHVYLQYPGPDDDVAGLRLNLIRSLNKNVSGIDIGLIFNDTKSNFTGLEIGGILNVVAGKARIFGLQWGGIFNSDKEATIVGLQLTAVRNWIVDEGTVVGGQIALGWNHAPKTDVYGFQIALINRAQNVYGFQLGLFNLARDLHGIQIGVFNFNEAGPIKFFPVINAGF